MLDAALALPSFPYGFPNVRVPLFRISRRSGYGIAQGAGDGRSVILDYAPEVHPSGEVGYDPWSRDN